MPIYEFECKKCNDKFEFLMLRKDEIVECPKCGSKKAEKVFSNFAYSGGDTGHSCSSGSHKCGSCSGHNCSTCK